MKLAKVDILFCLSNVNDTENPFLMCELVVFGIQEIGPQAPNESHLLTRYVTSNYRHNRVGYHHTKFLQPFSPYSHPSIIALWDYCIGKNTK